MNRIIRYAHDYPIVFAILCVCFTILIGFTTVGGVLILQNRHLHETSRQVADVSRASCLEAELQLAEAEYLTAVIDNASLPGEFDPESVSDAREVLLASAADAVRFANRQDIQCNPQKFNLPELPSSYPSTSTTTTTTLPTSTTGTAMVGTASSVHATTTTRTAPAPPPTFTTAVRSRCPFGTLPNGKCKPHNRRRTQ